MEPGLSLQSLVQARDPALDAQITAGFQRVFAALDAIPVPFEQSIVNVATSGPARAARNVSADLADLFDQDVSALLFGEPARPAESPAVGTVRSCHSGRRCLAGAGGRRRSGCGNQLHPLRRRLGRRRGRRPSELARSLPRDRKRDYRGAATLLKPAQPDRPRPLPRSADCDRSSTPRCPLCSKYAGLSCDTRLARRGHRDRLFLVGSRERDGRAGRRRGQPGRPRRSRHRRPPAGGRRHRAGRYGGLQHWLGACRGRRARPVALQLPGHRRRAG